MEPVFKVRFDMTREDFIAFNLYHQDHSPSFRRNVLRLRIGLFVWALILIVPPFVDGRLWPLWAGAASLAVSAFLAGSKVRKGVRKTVERMLEEGKNRGLLGAKEVTMDPVEICAAGAERSITTRWPAVERVVTTEDSLYVYISSVEAVVIPRRAFATPPEFEAFADAARRFQAEGAARAK